MENFTLKNRIKNWKSAKQYGNEREDELNEGSLLDFAITIAEQLAENPRASIKTIAENNETVRAVLYAIEKAIVH